MGAHAIFAVVLSVATVSSFGAALTWALPSGGAADAARVASRPAPDMLPEATVFAPLPPSEPTTPPARKAVARLSGQPTTPSEQQTLAPPPEEPTCTGWESLTQGPAPQRLRSCPPMPAEEEASVESPPRHLWLREVADSARRADVPSHPRIVVVVEPPP